MMMRTADFRDTDMNGIDDRDQPNFSGPSQNYLDQQERARNLLNPNLKQQVGNNKPQPSIEPIRRNPSPFGNNLSMGRFGGYNQPQPFMGGFNMPQMGYGGGFGYGMPQMGYGMQQMPFMGGFGGYGGGFGGFGMQPRMSQMGYGGFGGFGMQPRMPQMGYGGGFGGFGMPQMGGYGNPFGQSFYGGLGSFMGQPSFRQQGMPKQAYDRFGMPIDQGPIMTNDQIRPVPGPVMQLRPQPPQQEPAKQSFFDMFPDAPRRPEMGTQDIQHYKDPITGLMQRGSSTSVGYRSKLKKYLDSNPEAAANYYERNPLLSAEEIAERNAASGMPVFNPRANQGRQIIPRSDVGGGGRVSTMPIAPPGGFPRFGEDVGGGGRVSTMPIAPPGGFPRFNPS